MMMERLLYQNGTREPAQREGLSLESSLFGGPQWLLHEMIALQKQLGHWHYEFFFVLPVVG